MARLKMNYYYAKNRITRARGTRVTKVEAWNQSLTWICLSFYVAVSNSNH